jgi:hypothetical protein
MLFSQSMTGTVVCTDSNRAGSNINTHLPIGSTVARYSGENVYQRLAGEETYAAKDYHAALKKAFIGIDDDLRASKSTFLLFRLSPNLTPSMTRPGLLP